MKCILTSEGPPPESPEVPRRNQVPPLFSGNTSKFNTDNAFASLKVAIILLVSPQIYSVAVPSLHLLYNLMKINEKCLYNYNNYYSSPGRSICYINGDAT